MQFVLLHSPLVGPTTWRWVGDALIAAGHDVTVPDLRTAAVSGDPQAVIAAAAMAVPSGWTTPVVVGHSGAGPLLPLVAERLPGHSSRLVFVDAGLPPCKGRTTHGEDFVERLHALAVDGVLPTWSSWWGEGVMEMLVPGTDRRDGLEAEMPEIPIGFFETPLEVPTGGARALQHSSCSASHTVPMPSELARLVGPPPSASAVISTSSQTQTKSPT